MDNLTNLFGIETLHLEKGVGNNPLEWAIENVSIIDEVLNTRGALLVRGLGYIDSPNFAKILSTLFGSELLEYTYRSTPRTTIEKNVYTATEYHSSETISQHNENAYANSWPLRIGFLCVEKARKMGNTPLSDSRIAYQRIPKEIREEFERKKLMYVRNYSNIDLPWTEVFQTHEKNAVEIYCKQNNIHCEWTEAGLRTKQVGLASIAHPISKEMLWFNQAHLFHVSSLEKELEEGLIALLGEENIPRNAYFADGSRIDASALDEIRRVYDTTKVSFDWQNNDLLLLDNMLFTHGREPFEGERKVLVGMARNYQPD